MAEPLTRKDLETVIQKIIVTNSVTIENAKDIVQPLIDEQKKNDIKSLKERIETKAIFVGIQNGILSVADSIRGMLDKFGEWFKPKATKGLGILGIAMGILLAPIALLIGFGQGLVGQLRALDRLFLKGKLFEKIGNLFSRIGSGFSNITRRVLAFFRAEGKISKLFGWVKPLFSFLKGGFMRGFSPVFTIFKTIGRVLGKFVIPLQIIMSIVDGVIGFVKGYKEGGIIQGIKEAIVGIVDGLIGSLLRGLGWIVDKIFDFFGLEKLGEAFSDYFTQLGEFFNNTIRGLFDIVVGVFTLDGDTIMNGITSIGNAVKDLFDSALNVFKEIGKAIKDTDIFDDISGMIGSIGYWFRETFTKMKLWIAETFDWLPDWVTNTTQMKQEAEDELNQIEKDRSARELEILERKRERESRKSQLRGGASKTISSNDNSTTINIFNGGNSAIGTLSRAFE